MPVVPPAATLGAVIDFAITTRGQVSQGQRALARQRLAHLDRFVPDPILAARAMLSWQANPSLERPARAEAEIDVNGHLVCGRVAAETMSQAIGELAGRLERQLDDFDKRRSARQRRAPTPADGEWWHGAWSPPRPSYLPRPAGERELIRRKTFALNAMEPRQALAEMLDLDHDFYLFHDSLTGQDAVLYRRDDGKIGLIGTTDVVASHPADDGIVPEESRNSAPIALDAAIEEMNALSHRFMFFVDADSGRGEVIYMRYDGHYGLIESAA